ncbi:uncharacterized LOC100501924 [Zea mays]|uniref:Uncharacterized protein n=1 Tax=Zea mays TaxID=4577 RepID=C4J701_MAIZE|nr:uncharacterized LOC100501924 [Zea mays]ACR36951.1 unknown [Zea mays]|eukprot:NP_001183491.1 uncharacterized protein LOC100501924 [Zea mays]
MEWNGTASSPPGRGGVPRDAQPPAPGRAGGLLQPGRPPDAGVRVHAQAKPREPPFQESPCVPAMVDAAQDRRRRRQGPGVPARGRDARHLPRLQGLQYSSRLGKSKPHQVQSISASNYTPTVLIARTLSTVPSRSLCFLRILVQEQ